MSRQAAGRTPAVFDRALWFRWILANAAGWGIGGLAGRIVAALLGTTLGAIWRSTAASLNRDGPGRLFFALLASMVVVAAIAAGGAVVGAIVGILQSRVVGPHLRSPIPWVATTIEGAAIGVLVGVTVNRFVPAMVATRGGQVLAWTITGGAIGLFVGLAQRSVFSMERGRAASWTVANLVGWGLAGLAASVSATPATLNQGFASGWELRRIVDGLAGTVLFGLVGGTVGGGITGMILVRLLRTPAR